MCMGDLWGKNEPQKNNTKTMPSGPLPVAVSNSLFVVLSCPDERLNSSLFSPHQNGLSLLSLCSPLFIFPQAVAPSPPKNKNQPPSYRMPFLLLFPSSLPCLFSFFLKTENSSSFSFFFNAPPPFCSHEHPFWKKSEATFFRLSNPRNFSQACLP